MFPSFSGGGWGWCSVGREMCQLVHCFWQSGHMGEVAALRTVEQDGYDNWTQVLGIDNKLRADVPLIAQKRDSSPAGGRQRELRCWPRAECSLWLSSRKGEFPDIAGVLCPGQGSGWERTGSLGWCLQQPGSSLVLVWEYLLLFHLERRQRLHPLQTARASPVRALALTRAKSKQNLAGAVLGMPQIATPRQHVPKGDRSPQL